MNHLLHNTQGFLRRWPAHLRATMPITTIFTACACVVQIAWACVTPTIMCPDSLDYVANAITLYDTGSFAHFDGWRSPGYSVMLVPLVALVDDVRAAAGMLNVLLACIAIGLLAWSVRRLVFHAASSLKAADICGAIAATVIACDPLLLLWQRHAMPEVASMCVVALGVATLAWLATSARIARLTPARCVLVGAIAGGAIAAACFLRGNFQLLLVLAPICLSACAYVRTSSFVRSALIGTACLLVALGGISPWFARMHERTGSWSFTVGGQFARALFARETGLMDFHQPTVFDPAHIKRLTEMDLAGTLTPYAFIHEMNTGLLAPMGEGLPQLARTDLRAKILVDESIRRRPWLRVSLAGKAFATQLGIVPFDVPGYRENAYWSRALRRESTDKTDSMRGPTKGPTEGDTNWVDGNDSSVRDVPVRAEAFARTNTSIEAYRDSFVARGFDVVWRAGIVGRVVLAWIAVLGSAWLVVPTFRVLVRRVLKDGKAAELRQRDASVLAIVLVAACVASHGAAIAWVMLTGLDRYAFPVTPAWHAIAIMSVGVLTVRRARSIKEIL